MRPSKRLRSTIPLFALAAIPQAIAAASNGQQENVEAQAIEEIVIVGTRLQNQKSIAFKQESEKIVDVITADDIGSLPDFSVAESLTRVPGVSVEERNGDAEFVVIRGLRSDFNHLSLDGGLIPSTRNGGRATQTSIIPSYVIKHTEVVKSFNADLEGNAIGGQVLIETRSAFDQNDTYFAARGALGYFEQNDGPKDTDLPTRADIAFSEQFGDNNQFGLVLSVSYLNQDYYTYLPGVNWGEYRFMEPDGSLGRLHEDASDDVKRVPSGNQFYLYKNQIERLGGFAKFEWKPSDTFYTALTVYQFNEDDTEDRWSGSIYHDFKSLDNVTEDTGHVATGKGYKAYFLQGDENEINSVSLTGDWLIGANSTLDFIVVTAEGERTNPFDEFRYFGTSEQLAFSYDHSGEYPVISLDDPTAYNNHSLLRVNNYRQWVNLNSQDAFQAKVNYAYKMDAIDELGFKVGMAYREDERTQDRTFFHEYKPDTDAAKALSPANFLSDYSSSFEPNVMLGQEISYLDYDKFLSYWATDSDSWSDRRDQEEEALKNEYSVTEEISAAYIMGRYETDSAIFTAGLRYEHTDLVSTGRRELRDEGSSDKYPEITETNSYDNWLPSANVIWNFQENWKLRAAYSRSLGRAEYKDLSVLGRTVVDSAQQTVSISSSNPGLAPRVSDNIDFSLEHYFADIDGAFSLGYFTKDIDNEIFSRVSNYATDIEGVEYQVSEKRPSNANSAELKGIELGFTLNSFDFVSPSLTDVGISVNYSHIDSKFNIEMNDDSLRELSGLIWQPENIAKATVFWTPSDFEFKLAYRYTDDKLHTASASSPTYDEFIGETKKLDFHARYDFKNGLKVFLDARNLLDDGTARDLSYGETKWSRDYGRSLWIGASYKF